MGLCFKLIYMIRLIEFQSVCITPFLGLLLSYTFFHKHVNGDIKISSGLCIGSRSKNVILSDIQRDLKLYIKLFEHFDSHLK